MDLYFDNEECPSFLIRNISLYFDCNDDLRVNIEVLNDIYLDVIDHVVEYVIDSAETKNGNIYFYSKEYKKQKEYEEKFREEQKQKQLIKDNCGAIIQEIAIPNRYDLYINYIEKGIIKKVSSPSETELRLEYSANCCLYAETVEPVCFAIDTKDKEIMITTPVH